MSKKVTKTETVTDAQIVRAALDNFIMTLMPVTTWDEDGKSDLLEWSREKLAEHFMNWLAPNQIKFFSQGLATAQEAYDNAIFAERAVQEAARSEGREIAGNVYQSDVIWKAKAVAQRQAGLDAYKLLLDAMHTKD